LKLHWSPRSPFVRKVMIFAYETGLDSRLERVRSVVAMAQPNPALMRDNPLSKLPTLVLDDGQALFDSYAICDYLDGLHGGAPLIPRDGAERRAVLRWHALGNGLLDLLVLWRNERDREPQRQHAGLLQAFSVKCEAALARLEAEAPALEAAPFRLGHVAIVCALGYLDFRFAGLDWRAGRAGIAEWNVKQLQRASVRMTVPVDD